MRKRITVLLTAAALGVGAASPVALAQDSDAATEEDGTDYGWVGLLGLAGLAGLLGRKRDDRDRDDRDRRPGGAGR
jgi:MYXO-CTERM domain-containing protein